MGSLTLSQTRGLVTALVWVSVVSWRGPRLLALSIGSHRFCTRIRSALPVWRLPWIFVGVTDLPDVGAFVLGLS